MRSGSLLVGHYGSGNFGDDIMLAEIIIERDCAASDNSDVVVFFGNSGLCFKLRDDQYIVIDRKNRKEFIYKYISCLLRKERVIWGGGTCFTDEEGDGFFWWMLVAKMFGVKIEYKSVGVGNITRKSRQLKAWLLLRLADRVSLRDDVSIKKARELCVRDFAFEPDLGDAYLSRFCGSEPNIEEGDGGTLIVAWRDLNSYRDKDIPLCNVAAFVCHFVNNEPMVNNVVVLDTDNSVDFLVGEALFELLSSRICLPVLRAAGKEFSKKIELISKAQFVITSRLHIMIAASRFKKRLSVYSYSPKIDIAAKNIGCMESLVSKEYICGFDTSKF